jgi:preprotein translocase subunit SecG
LQVIETIIFIAQIVTAIALVLLMAVQTDKAEQGGGGVMGLGAAGGRTSGNVNMAVGAERILKPLTAWVGIGFLFSSFLNAIPKLTWTHVGVTLLIYLFVMLVGNRVWAAITRAFG